MSDKRIFSVRLPDELAETLKAVAKVRGRSMNHEIEVAVKNYVQDIRKDAVFQQRLRLSMERNKELLDKLSTT